MAAETSGNKSISQQDEEKHRQESEMLDFACRSLGNFAHNLHGFLEDTLPHLPLDHTALDSHIARLKIETPEFKAVLDRLIKEDFSKAIEVMCDDYDDIATLQSRIENLQEEWQAQQEHMGRMQAEMYKLRRQLQHQSSFCASLGAILGQLIWKSSQVVTVVDKILSGSKLSDFLCIVEGTLGSFLDTYRGSMPEPDSNERQFLMSLCGVVTNIAAVPAGREFLCSNPNGMNLVQAIVKAIPAVPMPTGRELKRLLVMVLYNISINKNGQALLQTPGALEGISGCFRGNTTPDLSLIALRVLQSVTYSISNSDILTSISEQIPMNDIRDLSKSEDPETKDQATAVLHNLHKATTELHATRKHNTQVPFYCTKQCN